MTDIKLLIRLSEEREKARAEERIEEILARFDSANNLLRDIRNQEIRK